MAKKKSNKILYYLSGAVLLFILFMATAKSKGWIGDDSIEVELGGAKRTTITEKVSASGTVQPVTEVKLAPEVSGEIISLDVQDGDSVKMGQALVKIRPDVWLSQLERTEASRSQQVANVEAAKAALERSKANLTKAEQDYKRQDGLWKAKVISEADWQLAQQNYLVAQNDVASSVQALEAARFVVNSTEASVRESRANVNKTTVVAPMNGIVSKLSVLKGERVVGAATMTGTELLRIADLRHMEVRVNVNENDIVRIHLGDSVIIDVDAYAGRKFKGLVTNIANTARDKVTSDAITEFEVRAKILRTSYADLIKAGNRYPFRPGLTTTVEIVTTTKANVLSVPLSAVTTRSPDARAMNKGKGKDKGGDFGNEDKPKVTDLSKPKGPEKKDLVVLFTFENGAAKMKEVKTGISDYDNIEILSGIGDSAKIITGPFLAVSKRLKDGDKVKETEKPKFDRDKDKP